MKLFAIATIAVLSVSTAYATETDYSVTIKNDKFMIGAEVSEDGFSKAMIGASLFKHDLSEKASIEFVTRLERDFDLDRTSLKNDFIYRNRFAERSTVYVIGNVDYHFGEYEGLIIGPTVGMAHSFTDRMSVYGDVTASFDAQDSFNYIGGEIGGGVSYGVNEATWLTVGFTRNFGTDWKRETSVYLNTTFAF